MTTSSILNSIGCVIKRGRPKSTMPKRDKLISVYLSSEEKEKIEQLARAEGISFAAFIRRAVLRETANAGSPSKPAKK